MNKQQYELLENFGLKRIVPGEMSVDQVEQLRIAIRDAVLVIPFAKVEGLEHMSSEFDNDHHDAAEN